MLYVVYYNRVLPAYLVPITEQKSRNAAGNGILGLMGHRGYQKN